MEEFDVSLGVDPSVKVTYKPVKKFQQRTGVISKSDITDFHQVIEIKNTKPQPVKILVTDQCPLPHSDKIKVIRPYFKQTTVFSLSRINGQSKERKPLINGRFHFLCIIYRSCYSQTLTSRHFAPTVSAVSRDENFYLTFMRAYVCVLFVIEISKKNFFSRLLWPLNF